MSLKLASNSSHNIIYQLKALGCIKISGNDSTKFLQGQISTNAEEMEQNKLQLSSICTHQGRIVTLFWAAKVDDVIYLIMSKEIVASTIIHLNKYAVFFKTEISDTSEQFKIDSFFHSSQPDSEPDINTHSIQKAQFSLSDSQLTLRLTPIENSASELDRPEQDNDWFYQLAIRQIPWLTLSTQSKFLPHNLNLPALNAVDFNKGCFTGQEVIARMQYKGKLKSHMHLLTSKTLIEITPETKIWANNKSAGEIICTASSPPNGTALLALIKDNDLKNKYFQLNSENGPILKLN